MSGLGCTPSLLWLGSTTQHHFYNACQAEVFPRSNRQATYVPARLIKAGMQVKLCRAHLFMPVKITKKKGGCVKVSTPNGTKSKCTTAKKAAAQKRLLNAIEHGWTPTGNK